MRLEHRSPADAAVGVAAAINIKEKPMIKVLKNLIGNKDSSPKDSGKETQASPKSDKMTEPHASGGCCGGCGGEKV